MAGQAILGESVLKPAMARQAVANTLGALVADYTQMVFRIAYSILRTPHDAEDATQECFLRALKHQDLLPQLRSPKTWLSRLAWTAALDKRRSLRPMDSLDDEQSGGLAIHSIADTAAAPEQQVAGREMQQMLERLIAGLPEDLRCPLELSTVQELNSAEIAEIMEIPEGSVRTRLFRARKQLKDKLAVLLKGKTT